MPAIIAGIIIGFISLFLYPPLALVGLLIAGIGWFYLRKHETTQPYIYSGQTRGITLGVVDPNTLRKSYWKLLLPTEIHIDHMIEWVSTLQNKIYELHGKQESQFVFNP